MLFFLQFLQIGIFTSTLSNRPVSLALNTTKIGEIIKVITVSIKPNTGSLDKLECLLLISTYVSALLPQTQHILGSN